MVNWIKLMIRNQGFTNGAAEGNGHNNNREHGEWNDIKLVVDDLEYDCCCHRIVTILSLVVALSFIWHTAVNVHSILCVYIVYAVNTMCIHCLVHCSTLLLAVLAYATQEIAQQLHSDTQVCRVHATFFHCATLYYSATYFSLDWFALWCVALQRTIIDIRVLPNEGKMWDRAGGKPD